MPVSRAPRRHWERLWEGSPPVPAIDPGDRRLDNHVRSVLHRWFTEALAASPRPGRLLEVGCANSPWLPYFSRVHGFAVEGLDYSPAGCDLARRMLAREGVEGRVVCADFTAPPGELLGRYDVVVSLGVVEHFEDASGTLAALTALLRPGGLLLTVVPNLTAFPGRLVRLLNPRAYARHVALSRRALLAGCAGAGLHAPECRPLVALNLSLVPADHLRPRVAAVAVRYLLWWASKGAWAAERSFGPGLVTDRFAGYFACRAARPRDGSPPR